MKSKSKHIGLIGLGGWGKNILRNLDTLDVLHTACDSDPKILAERKKSYKDVNFTGSYQEILENTDITAVAIATPAVTHHKLAKEALFAGKDVFVEKPLAVTVNEGRDLVEMAGKMDRILMVGHILQYHPAVEKLKEIVSSGELGKIRYIYSNRLNIGKLRTEENILWSFAPHDISVILMLLGEEPVRVRAFGKDYLNRGIYDTSLTTLEFKEDISGHIFVNWLHPFKEQKMIVVGSKAMAVFDDMSTEKLFLYPHTIEWKNGKVPVAQKAACQAIPVEEREPLMEELAHFVECVRSRKNPRTDGHEGLRVLKVLESAEADIKEANSKASGRAQQPYFIHETACVDDGVSIGKGTRIWHFSHILGGSKVGENCVIGQNVVIGPDVSVGDGCKIQNNVSLYKGVTLEEGVFCGPSCVFTNVYNPRAFIERKSEFLPTLVKKGATIGANAAIVCGATIGRYAMIGAGAVVKGDVEDHSIVVGVPARHVGWACTCGTTLKFIKESATCAYCGAGYTVGKDRKLRLENDGM